MSSSLSKIVARRSLFISISVFFFLMAIIFLPVSLKLSVFNPEKEVVSIGDASFTSQDVVVVSSLAAGSVAIGAFFSGYFLPTIRSIRRSRR